MGVQICISFGIALWWLKGMQTRSWDPIVPFTAVISNFFILMQDKARSYTVPLVENFIEVGTVQCMVWPAHSFFYFNPIEQVLNILRQCIVARPMPPVTAQDLEITFLQEWNSIPQNLIDNLITSMANRYAALLAVQENHKPY